MLSYKLVNWRSGPSLRHNDINIAAYERRYVVMLAVWTCWHTDITAWTYRRKEKQLIFSLRRYVDVHITDMSDCDKWLKMVHFKLGNKMWRVNWSTRHEHGTKKKIWVPDRSRTRDLPDTGRAHYPPSYENSWRAMLFNWVHMNFKLDSEIMSWCHYVVISLAWAIARSK